MAEPAADDSIIYIQVMEKSADEGTNHNPSLDVKLEISAEQKESQKDKTANSDIVTHQEKRVRCPECKFYTTENEEKMVRHIRKMHRGENPFQCYMCDYSTYNNVCFEEHVRVHQGIKPYKCSYCPHRTVSKKNMKKHELVHRPDNPLKCQQCDYFGRHRRSLEFHMKKCHSTTPNSNPSKETDPLCCVRCGVKFENEALLRNHNNLQHKCSKCDYMGCSKEQTKQHLLNTHVSIKKPKVKNKKEKEEFKCAVCGWTATYLPRVLLHLIHHPNQVVDESKYDLSILRKHGIVR